MEQSKKNEFQKSILKWASIYLTFLAVLIFCFLFWLEKRTVVAVNEVAQDEIVVTEEPKQEEVEEKDYLIVQRGDETDLIQIPLNGDVTSTGITAENHYLNDQIRVAIAGATKDFYKDLVITGNKMQVQAAKYHIAEDGLHIQFDMDTVYEISTKYEKDMLTIFLEKPKKKYEKIVILDPAMEYGDITWNIVARAKELLDAEGIKVYYSRTAEGEIADLAKLASSIYSDMLIRVELGESDDENIYGTEVAYYGDYFTPTISNVTLADIMEHKVTTALEGKALGIVDLKEQDHVIHNLTVPAVVLKPGYISNSEEKHLLEQEQYRQRIAEGIFDAVMEVYEKRN